VFVRDLLADRTLLVSVDSSGVACGNGISSQPSLSADGRYVAFSSTATNLVAGDANNLQDVFVRDLLTETTSLVSVNAYGMSGNRASYSATISSDGHAILFHSQAGDLAGGVGMGYDNLFWRDLSQNITYRVSSFASISTSVEIPAAMTPDGRYVALGSQTPTWYLWDSQLHTNIYTAASLGGVLSRIALSADGNRLAYTTATGVYFVDLAAGISNQLGLVHSSATVGPRFSADSHYLAYVTSSTNVVSDTNGLYDVYLYDCQSGSNILVSQAFNAPTPANGDSDSPDISPDGRFVAYRSAASNLVPNDSNGVPDVFLWDRLTGATILLSASRLANSTADNRSLTPVFSGDGTTLLFESWASDMVPLDFNRASDLFLVSLLSSGAMPLFRASILPATGSPGQGVWITWPAVQNKTYRVQFKDALADPGWQELGGGVIMIGNQGYLNDSSAFGSQRFYRVVAQ
jgi:Tol biopolymer transport system component